MNIKLMHLGLLALFIAAAAGLASAGPAPKIVSWGGDIKKCALTYYTYDSMNNLVANKVSFAKPRGVTTPNVVLYTQDSTGPEPLVNMSIVSDINGRFFLNTGGELLPDSRGASGHTDGLGVLLLDNTLHYDPVSGSFSGSGKAIRFSASTDVTSVVSVKNGISAGAAKVYIHPRNLTLEEYNADSLVDSFPSKVVMKPFSVRFSTMTGIEEPFNYSPYDGDWNFTYKIIAGSDPSNPDIGVSQNGTLTLNMDPNGTGSIAVPGSSCATVYKGQMKGPTIMLTSPNESSVTGPGCNGNGEIVLTFSSTVVGDGTFVTYDPDGSWVEGSLRLT